MDKFVWDWERYKDEPKDYEIVVTADTNDADYITRIENVSMKMIEEVVKPAVELLKTVHGSVPWHGWNDVGTGIFAEDSEHAELLNIFQDFFVPFGEHGVHTIESVVYYPLPVKVVLL